MDKYWKYCRDAETRELTGKGNRIYDDDDKEDDYNNNINEQDYYGVAAKARKMRCMQSKRESFANLRKIFCEVRALFARRRVKRSEFTRTQ